MKKIFTFLCAALMSVGMWAEPITVTWNNDDISGSGNSFTKDGVTLTCGMNIDWDDKIFLDGGTFTTNLGNFTQIVVTAGDCGISGEGWSGNSAQKTWTGNAASVSYSGEIMGMEDGVTFVFTIEEPTPEPAKYYVVGNMTEWAVDENYEMNPNIYAETEEYFYAMDLTTTSEFKVVKVENGVQSWFPSGVGNNYGQNGEITEDAEYTIYFRPNYDGGEDWFYNCIYVSKNEPEPAGEVTIVFAANDKTVERTVTLPHTFKCDWAAGMEGPDELDIIIHELYNDYYYCNSNMNASGSDQVEAGTEEDPKNDYITIKGVFEGTATVTGDYLDYVAGDYGEHNYSITISIKGDEPQPQETVVTITEADYVSGNTITKDGVTLTVNQIYGVGSWYLVGPGTFTNTIGNFTKIEVTTVGGTVFIEGDGWTGDFDKMTWTGNAPSVSFVDDIMGKGQGFSIVCTIAAGEPEPAGKPIVVFEANGNRKEVEVELPHTFWCDLINENGELDLIIQELYALPQGGYCDYYYDGPVATGNPAVTAGADDDANHFITISEAFEGTATVSGKYNKYTEMDEEDFTYTLTISIKYTPTAVENVQTNQVQGIKILRDGMLLIVRDGKIFNVTGAQVR